MWKNIKQKQPKQFKKRQIDYKQSPHSWKKLFGIFVLGYSLMLASAMVYLYHRGFPKRAFYNVSPTAVSGKPPSSIPVVREFSTFPTSKMERKSPCLGSKTLRFRNMSSESLLQTHAYSNKLDEIQIVQYLSKFNKDSANQTLLHIPDWVDRLFNGGSNHTDTGDNKGSRSPYFLSAVVRLRLYEEDKAKLSMAELKQWIHYQLWAGAEHIYICNHFLKESERVEPHLKRYIDLDLVTVYPWSNITAIPGTPSYLQDNSNNQDGCYNHVLRHHSKDSVWQYNMDMDEYPYVPSDQCEGFFKRYLFNLDTVQRDNLVTQIKLRNFLMKGVGDRSRDMTVDRINRIDGTQSNPLVKPCYKLEYTTRVGTHGVTTTMGKTNMPPPHEIVMLHYWGARTQNWGPDTKKTLRETVEFNGVRETIAVNVRQSLLLFADFQGFSNKTGP